MKPLTLKDYQREVQDFPGPVILFFTALWATPAIKTADFLRSSNLEIKIFSVDYDTERELVEKFSVRDLPTVFFLRYGHIESYTYDGVTTEVQLKALIK
jgi:thioredoxin-like negative regulator of GroEL